MNYQSIYDQLVSKYKDYPKVKKQTEDHHIIPKSFAKVDNIEDIDGKWNRVNLPIREHFIAHLLLARIWRHDKIKGSKMAWAFIQMSKNRKVSSKSYTWLKLHYSHSKESKAKITAAGIGRKHTEESKAKMSYAAKNRTDEHKAHLSKALKGKPGKSHTVETKAKLSKASKGKTHTAETKAKLAEMQLGRKYSEESRAKMSARAKARPRKKCPVCNKEIQGDYNFLKHMNTH